MSIPPKPINSFLPIPAINPPFQFLAPSSLSSSSFPSASSTPKPKKGGRAYGSKSEVTPVNADHPLPLFLINHEDLSLFLFIL